MGLLTSCTTAIKEYQDTRPKLDLFNYFSGKTYAWGQFADRNGKVIRRFKVDITGTIEDNQLTLDERFVYDNGEHQQRIWHISDLGGGRYEGEAGDIVGKAQGQTAGSVLNWHYTLKLPYKDTTINVKFDDWMFLHEGSVMMNTANVSKFGFHVGTVTLFFAKLNLAAQPEASN